MKKIILIANNARSMVVFRANLIKKLISSGYKVVVVVPYEKESIEQLESIGAKVELFKLARKGMNPFCEIASILQLYKILRQYRSCVCMFYTIKPVIYGSIVCSLLSIKKVFSMITGLGYVFTGHSLLHRLLTAIVKLMYVVALKNNKKVFFLNRDDLGYFVNNKIISKSQACLINGEGVDLNRFAYAVPSLQQLSFLFVGRLLKDKGIYEYISAVRILKGKYPRVVFRLVGDLDDNPSSIAKGELDSWVNEGLIDYMGYLSDVRPALSEASVFVLPSYREGMPVSILEAMATGRPVVTTDVSGCRDAVEDGVNGFLVPAKEIDLLVEAMERFILDPSLIARMGMKGRQMVEEKFCDDKIIPDLLATMDLL